MKVEAKLDKELKTLTIYVDEKIFVFPCEEENPCNRIKNFKPLYNKDLSVDGIVFEI